MGRVLLIVISAALLALVIGGAIYGWNAAGVNQMSAHGWVALGLGVVLTSAVGGGLMALVFYSSRSGHDEAAHYEDEHGEGPF